MAKVTWEVDDGYCGGSCPHVTDVPNDELDECESEEERLALIEDYVREDYEQKITWHIKRIDA